MFYDNTVWHYEVLGYNNPEGRGQEAAHEWPIARKADALRIGRTMSRTYKRVEVIAVETDANDTSNLLGDKLVAAWENGRKTA